MSEAVEPHPLDVREQLIRGSLRLISREGPVDLSVRRLAQAADRTTMCIYSKFTSRSGLLRATYERAAADLLARLDASAGVRGSATLGLAEEYRLAAVADPGLYALLFEQPLTALGIEPSLRHQLIAAVVHRLTTALVADETPPDRARGTAQTLWATMHGLVALHLVSLNLADAAEPADDWADAYRAAADAYVAFGRTPTSPPG